MTMTRGMEQREMVRRLETEAMELAPTQQAKELAPAQQAETSALPQAEELTLCDVDGAYEALGLRGIQPEQVQKPEAETEETEEKEAARIHYRRGLTHAREMAVFSAAILDPEREFLLSRIHRVLVQAMREVVTRREAECMELYYVQALNFRQISARLRINVSTISRNIQRGELKVVRLLTLARAILGQDAA